MPYHPVAGWAWACCSSRACGAPALSAHFDAVTMLTQWCSVQRGGTREAKKRSGEGRPIAGPVTTSPSPCVPSVLDRSLGKRVWRRPMREVPGAPVRGSGRSGTGRKWERDARRPQPRTQAGRHEHERGWQGGRRGVFDYSSSPRSTSVRAAGRDGAAAT
nr:unnamed protein product [Digitaria exilis]CAB3504776.1 unnamed protein product [Digitaria exilis]CAB3505109.1 unnamed protein product [Digitaria exilis]